MKRYITAFLFAVIGLAFSNCSKEIAEGNQGGDVPVSEGIPFTVTALGEKMRTGIGNGLAVKWKEGDAINLFHAVLGTKNYEDDGKFTVSDTTAGTFSGTLKDTLDAGSSYVWYAIYPYDASASGPNAGSVAALGIGGGSKDTQVQDHKNDFSRLAGQYMPLYGRDTTSSSSAHGGTTVNFTMQQLASIIQIKVVNNSGAKLPVRKIGFKFGTEKIFGNFLIRIDDKKGPVYTLSSAVSDSVTLNVTSFTGEQMLEPGETASYYIGVKPYTTPANAVLSMSVNGYEKSKTVSSVKDFAAGSIKPFTFNYDREAYYYVKVSSLDEITSGEYIVTSGDYLLPNAATSSSPEAKEITDYGYFTESQFTEPSIRTSSDEITWTLKKDGSGFTLSSARNENLHFTTNGKAEGTRISNSDASICEFEKNDTGLSMKSSGRYNGIRGADFLWYSYTTKKYTSFYNSGILNLYKKEDSEPVIYVNDINDVPSKGVTDSTANYEVRYFTDDVEVKSFSGCVSSASASAGTITYSVPRNYGDTLALGTIVLYSGSKSLTRTINVTQNVRDSITITRTVLSEFGGTINGTRESDFKLDSIITATGSTDGNNSKIYGSTTNKGDQWRFYETKNGTVTISSTSQKYDIVSVSIVYESYSNNGNLNAGGSSYTSGSILKVNGSFVTFSVGHSSGNDNGIVNITEITASYAEKKQ